MAASVSPAPDDAELVALLRQQPAAGIAALYDRFGRLVYSVAFRVVHDHGAAEEITQDVFMRCWRTIDRYQPQQSSLATWLLTITRNRAVDELRSRRGSAARREVSDELLQPLASEAEFDEPMLREGVQQALQELPAAQREAIELVFWGGLTRREVAEHLQVPLGTIHTRLRLGMDKLRVTLGHWWHDDLDEPAA
ncbi:MAG TPA: sigma-70 family RNA polymerase sigma factor [Roseiflexaceae bacterium]|nr:sigma-70 family RNA polymerase sigma factor [Roseiflexaceae bacterium]